MTGIGILWPLIRVLLDAVVLRIVSVLVPGFRLDNWSTAFTVAIVMAVTGWLSGPLVGLLPETGLWLFVLVELVVTTIILGVTSLFLDGMEFRGFGALIISGLLVTAIGFLPFVWPYVLRVLASE